MPPSVGKVPAPAKNTTPMMAQFIEIKAANADSLLFYRMGDFFELFFEDAVIASQALGIQLTKRGKHGGEDIPMCGVPVRKADEYLQKLIAQGFKVAVCEQLENPAEAKKRGHKAVVRRDVVRLVTPGTLTEETLLDARTNNFLTALQVPKTILKATPGSGQIETGKFTFALASLDISTGEFYVSEALYHDLPGEIARLAPKEILVPDSLYVHDEIIERLGQCEAVLSPVPDSSFHAAGGKASLKDILGVRETGGYGDFSKDEWAAIGALLRYVEITQINSRPVINPPQKKYNTHFMQIDAATRSSLELVRSAATGGRTDSLLGAIDQTVTSAGSRELARLLTAPSTHARKINQRLDAVTFLLSDTMLLEDLRTGMRGTPDIARALSRLALGRGGPRDLGAVRDGLLAAQETGKQLADALEHALAPPEKLAQLAKQLLSISKDMASELNRALVADLPLVKKEGGFIAAGYLDKLDEARLLKDKSRQFISDLKNRYQNETGIRSLKIKHNNVLGYFIEVSAASADPLMKEPASKTFFHRQTLANSMRFGTSELGDLASRIERASEEALELELTNFDKLADKLLSLRDRLADCARALAQLDHFCGLARLADKYHYVRPVVDDSQTFIICGGRHPVVEQALQKESQSDFIENDCFLGQPPADAPPYDQTPEPQANGFAAEEDDADKHFPEDARIWLLTGPNMAGKSTFLRQNALIAILAQMGSFVPASHAHIGIVDRLFSRVGASDDLARGRSTFMVEMVETAGILNQASEKSLVILDEIGRGTATYDGLAIAWATLEHLHNENRCRALFATHYHELTALANTLPQVTNATVSVREWKDSIIFLHKIRPGAADRSYGIMVARLAGLPQPVIDRALEVLQRLENSDKPRLSIDALEGLPLFGALEPAQITPPPNTKKTPPVPSAGSVPPQLKKMLDTLAPDDMPPRKALDFLYQLQSEWKKNK